MGSLNKKRKQFIVISLVVPLLLLIGFVMVPAFDLLRMSFTDWDGYSATSNFVGFENYIDIQCGLLCNPLVYDICRACICSPSDK